MCYLAECIRWPDAWHGKWITWPNRHLTQASLGQRFTFRNASLGQSVSWQKRHLTEASISQCFTLTNATLGQFVSWWICFKWWAWWNYAFGQVTLLWRSDAYLFKIISENQFQIWHFFIYYSIFWRRCKADFTSKKSLFHWFFRIIVDFWRIFAFIQFNLFFRFTGFFICFCSWLTATSRYHFRNRLKLRLKAEKLAKNPHYLYNRLNNALIHFVRQLFVISYKIIWSHLWQFWFCSKIKYISDHVDENTALYYYNYYYWKSSHTWKYSRFLGKNTRI